MLNQNFSITPRDFFNADLRWTAPGDSWVSWVFINGEHALGPIFIGTALRVVRIPFVASESIQIEVHDLPTTNVVPVSINARPNTRPLMKWNGVANAARYRIYHRKTGDAADTLIYDQPDPGGMLAFEVACPIELTGEGGVWHFLRVEAVDLYGNESARQSWTFFVMDLPTPPSLLTVADGSAAGLYDISLI